jgi:LysR family transcriptional regulator, glycine cleavage system transcriptional activator
MTGRLPPLNSLRAFTVAARHLSFKAAAAELHVTPAAISHQVKTLEDYLGVALFRRINHGLVLTIEGQLCLPQLQQGFELLEEGIEQLHANRQTLILRLGVPPSLATKWLMPRLPSFLAAAPEIKIKILASMNAIDMPKAQGSPMLGMDDSGDSPADIAIRFGSSELEGYRYHKLFSVAITPMCSPTLVEGRKALRKPKDLTQQVLLHDDSAQYTEPQSYWDLWLSNAEVSGIDSSNAQHFSHSGLALDAAVNGLGVVATLSKLAESDLADGRLIMPFDLSVPLQSAYYLVYSEEYAEQAKIVAFRDWILAERDVA